MDSGSSVPLPAHLEAQGVAVTLAEYFQKEYKSGGVFCHDAYCDDDDDENWCWRHKNTNIKVWRDAIDLSANGSGPLECVFHYTTEIGFRNITNSKKKAAEIFASLITEGDKANAWWGKGVYTVRKAPDEWPDVQTLLDNNFRNMLKRDIEMKGLEVATEEYQARVAFCIPILSRSSINIDVSVSQTPEMLAQNKPPGINLAGKSLDGRQCVVVRIEEEDQVGNASAVLVETLRRRACAASEKFGQQTEESLRADFRLGKVLHDRGAYEEAEPLLRRVHESTVASLGPNHPHTLESVNRLACLLQSQGKFTEAEPLYRRALEGREATLGPKHPDTLDSVFNLADFLEQTGSVDEAEQLYIRELQGMEALHGKEHDKTVASRKNLKRFRRSLKKAQRGRLRAR